MSSKAKSSRSMSKSKLMSKNKSRPKDRSSKSSGSKKRTGNKFRQASHVQQSQQEQNNQNSLVQKNKLLSMSSDKQVQLLKQLHNKIVVNPQENIKHIESIFALIKTPNLKIVSTALRVLAEIFINIAPLEAVDVDKVEQRTENRIKKEQYKVLKFEKDLVAQYDRYLKMLKQIHLKTRPQNFANDQEVYTQFKKCLLQCVIKLYRTLWNFNYAKQLNDLCLKFVRYSECREFLREMLMDKNMAMIGIKSRIISGISNIIKKQQFEKKLPSDIIQIINSTFIDSRYLKKDEQALNYKKKQLKKRLYREQAQQKKKQKEKRAQKGTLQMKRQKREEKAKQKLRVRDQVNREFAEGQTSVNAKQLTRQNSKILQQLFYIYFKILVEHINSIFLKDVLDGVLKFVHLINIQLTQSLITHLDSSAAMFRDMWKLKKTTEGLETRLLLIFTGQSIINGPLSVFNMDDVKMTAHFYKIMKDINADKTIKITKEVYRLICITLEEAFVKRRQLSQEVVGSFTRQIAIFLSTRDNLPKIYLLQLIRTLAYRYGKISRMFEQDNQGFGLNSFNSMCQDPHISNAINTQIISYLKQIKVKYSKQEQNHINRVVEKLCRQNFQPKDVKQSLWSILEHEMENHF